MSLKNINVGLLVFFLMFPQIVYCAQSTFDTDLDGWTGEGTGSFLYENQGGNPGGFVKFLDISGTTGDGWLVAPTKFLGDWSSFEGKASLSWDHIILQIGGVPEILQAQAIISGPGGSARCTTTDYMQTSWKTFSTPIDVTKWAILS